jgi:phosphoribosylformylglycinamidine synthase PurS subunit
MKVRVSVTRRPGILDPEGRAITRALRDLGFQEVVDVTTGKLLTVELADAEATDVEARVREMCEKLLANPVMEQYAIEVLARP